MTPPAPARTGWGRSLPLWRPLAVPDFRLLWTSQAVSLVGDQFTFIALAWLVLQVTGSGLALGVVLIASGVPRAALLVPFGALADRADPRPLVLTAHLVRGAIVASMAALAFGGAPSIPVLAGLTVAFGIADALAMPVHSSWVPRLVRPTELAPANALLQGTAQLTNLAGPPVAGLVVAVVGSGAAFALDAVSFLVAALIVARIGRAGARAALGHSRVAPVTPTSSGSSISPPPPPPGDEAADAPPSRPSFMADVRSGIAYAAREPGIRAMLIVQLALNLAFNGPTEIGIPWLADRRFDAGPVGMGLLIAAWGGGALVGTVVAGNLRLAHVGWLVTGLAAVAALGLAGLGVTTWLGSAMAILAVMGVAIGIVNILALSWLQRRIERAFLGRVMSLSLLMSLGATPFSLGVAGLLVDVDATAMFAAAGSLVLLSLGLGIALRLPGHLDSVPVVGRAEA